MGTTLDCLVAELTRTRAERDELQQRCEDLQRAYDALAFRTPSMVLAGHTITDRDLDHLPADARFRTFGALGATRDARTAQLREDSDLGQLDSDLYRRGVIG